MIRMADAFDVESIGSMFTAAAERGQRMCFFTCDIDLQKPELMALEQATLSVREAKRKAIAAQIDKAANLLLGFEVLLRAIAYELHMWIALKENRSHDAWVAFVSAQEHACLAVRTPASHSGVAGYVGRLAMIEQTIFPKLQFVSMGLTHAGGLCSICRRPFGDCPHVEGRIYCGLVCAEVQLQSVQADHGSLVEVPRDKRCYVTEYTDSDGVWRDVMTRAPTGREGSPYDGDDGFQVQCVMLTMETPPGVNA